MAMMFRDLGECVDHLLDLAWEDVEALDEHSAGAISAPP
jgi:hypothetical protein